MSNQPAAHRATARVDSSDQPVVERTAESVRRVAHVLRLDRLGRWLGRHRAAFIRLAPDLVLAFGLAVNAVVLLMHSTGIWFWADDWDLLFMRGAVPAEEHGLLEPHNNHWLTAHILIYRTLFDFFGIASYTPFAATAIAFHLTTALLARLVVRRAGASPWVSTATALMIAFFGLGANAQIPSASLNHVGALVCGFIALFIAARTKAFDASALTRCSIALIVSLMFGLTSLSLVVLVATFVALQHGLRWAAGIVAVPAAVFVAWWFAYGRHNGVNSISPEFDLFANLPNVPAFVWKGLIGTLGDGSGLTGSGPLLAGLIMVSLLAPAPRGSEPPAKLVKLAWASVVAALFQLLAVSIARFSFGADQIGASHYAYINIVLLSPGIALVGMRLLAWSPVPRWALGALVAVVFVAYALNGVTWVRKWQQDFQFVTGGSDDVAYGIKAALEKDEEPLNEDNPDPFNKGLSPTFIGAPRVMKALGDDHQATPKAVLNAETVFFTSVDPDDHGLAHPPVELRTVGTEPLKDAPGCQVVTATQANPVVHLRTDDEGNEIVVWSGSTKVSVRLERDGLSGNTRDFEVEPGAVHVATTAKDVDLYATFNGDGDYTICRG
jgi:hypothetical protein